MGPLALSLLIAAAWVPVGTLGLIALLRSGKRADAAEQAAFDREFTRITQPYEE